MDPIALCQEIEDRHGRIINSTFKYSVPTATKEHINATEAALGFEIPTDLTYYFSKLYTLKLTPNFLSAKPDSTYSLANTYKDSRDRACLRILYPSLK